MIAACHSGYTTALHAWQATPRPIRFAVKTALLIGFFHSAHIATQVYLYDSKAYKGYVDYIPKLLGRDGLRFFKNLTEGMLSVKPNCNWLDEVGNRLAAPLFYLTGTYYCKSYNFMSSSKFSYQVSRVAFEELVFRGYIQKIAIPALGSIAAYPFRKVVNNKYSMLTFKAVNILITTSLFALMHTERWDDPFQLTSNATGGLFFGLAAEAHSRAGLALSIAIHLLWNRMVASGCLAYYH